MFNIAAKLNKYMILFLNRNKMDIMYLPIINTANMSFHLRKPLDIH